MIPKKRLCIYKRSWVLITGILLSSVISLFYLNLLQCREKANIARIRTIYADRTENVINSIFHKTDVLAAAVKLENGNISEETFDDVAEIVYQKNSGIRGIQYMPGAVVTYSYPIAGNEQVIGKNFFKIHERRKDVMLAINTRSIALSGPYNLIQGGLGVVARNPVFLNDASGHEYFWGFSAIILDLPDALESVGLDHLKDDGYDFQLFCINENSERLVIAGNTALNTAKAICGTIQVPHHQWTLAISNRSPWQNPLKALVAFCIGFTLSFIMWWLSCMVDREKAAVQAKDRFFSNISHDMRTPLNAVLGFTTLAQSPGLSSSEKDVYLTKIGSAGKLLLELVNDTLTLSKANNGKIQLHPEPYCLEDLANSILPTVSVLADSKDIHLVIDTSGCQCRIIMIDRLNAEKIFLNLLTNAVKYTPAGGHVWLTVKDAPADAGDAGLVFTIRDDGIGMSKEFLEHLYEPFSQENRPGYESAGTGLGLAIVKQLINLMGGSIDITSEKDKGTEITVRLHFPVVTTETAAKSCTCEPPVDMSTLRGKRILLCEDNALNREIATALLKNKGVHVCSADNGKAGLDIFKNSPEHGFDAILMDLRMPVMGGLEAARAIRTLDRYDSQTIPIIAMTADAFSSDVENCIAAGMNGHIAKPVIPEELYDVLCRNI